MLAWIDPDFFLSHNPIMPERMEISVILGAIILILIVTDVLSAHLPLIFVCMPSGVFFFIVICKLFKAALHAKIVLSKDAWYDLFSSPHL